MNHEMPVQPFSLILVRVRRGRGPFLFCVCFNDAVNFTAEGIPVRQVQLVPAYEELVIDTFERVLYGETVLFGAQNDSKGLVIALGTYLMLEIVEIEVHLANVFVLYTVFFKVDQAVRLEDYIVEHKVDMEVPPSEGDVILPSYEGESFAKFQHEHTEIIGKGVFQSLLVPGGKFRQAGEFQDEGIAYDVFGFLDLDALICKLKDSFFVFGQGETLEKRRTLLPLEFADAPLLGFALLSVEVYFQRIVGFEDFEIVAPTQNVRHCLTFWETNIEFPHIEDIAAAETLSVAMGQIG